MPTRSLFGYRRVPLFPRCPLGCGCKSLVKLPLDALKLLANLTVVVTANIEQHKSQRTGPLYQKLDSHLRVA